MAVARLLGLCAGVLLAGLVAAEAGGETFAFGYVQLTDDPRYRQTRLDRRYVGRPWGRPVAGAEVAIEEAKFPGMAVGVQFAIERREAGNAKEAVAAVEDLRRQGARFILLDLPGELVAKTAAATADSGVLLLNVAAGDNRLRQRQCRAHLWHTLPSDAMRHDALAQYLVSRKWRDILMLAGPRPADRNLAQSFRRSAKRFGLEIVETRAFTLGNDPRERDENNIRLLTSGVDYDAVYIADSDGEFARNAVYAVQKPRPVVGGAGLVPQAWHWAWRRHGARQLNNRLEAAAGRRMTGHDWAAWIAVKAVVEAVLRTESTHFQALRDYLGGDEIVLDGFKGYRMGFRNWNHQLRQAVLLGGGNWVVARAPLEGFLHPENYLDTLGFDPRESECDFDGGE